MSRSVNYLDGADQVIYLSAHEVEDEFDWDLFQENIVEGLKAEFPSLEDADGWDNRETRIVLENRLAEIGISEYCGLVSVSIRAKYQDGNDYAEEASLAPLAAAWVSRIGDRFGKFGDLRKVGTFSNGEAIFESAGDPKHTYSSKEGLCEWLEPAA